MAVRQQQSNDGARAAIYTESRCAHLPRTTLGVTVGAAERDPYNVVPLARQGRRRSTLLPFDSDTSERAFEWLGPTANKKCRTLTMNIDETPARHGPECPALTDRRRQTLSHMSNRVMDGLRVPGQIKKHIHDSIDTLGKVATFIIAEYPAWEDDKGDTTDTPAQCPPREMTNARSELATAQPGRRATIAEPIKSGGRRRTLHSLFRHRSTVCSSSSAMSPLAGSKRLESPMPEDTYVDDELVFLKADKSSVLKVASAPAMHSKSRNDGPP